MKFTVDELRTIGNLILQYCDQFIAINLAQVCRTWRDILADDLRKLRDWARLKTMQVINPKYAFYLTTGFDKMAYYDPNFINENNNVNKNIYMQCNINELPDSPVIYLSRGLVSCSLDEFSKKINKNKFVIIRLWNLPNFRHKWDYYNNGSTKKVMDLYKLYEKNPNKRLGYRFTVDNDFISGTYTVLEIYKFKLRFNIDEIECGGCNNRLIRPILNKYFKLQACGCLFAVDPSPGSVIKKLSAASIKFTHNANHRPDHTVIHVNHFMHEIKYI